MIYLESFTLPIEKEEYLLKARAQLNGGMYGYIDNPYPCGLFTQKELSEIWFKDITILYGGNGSGKSTLLNLISEKLELNQISPHNSGEMFDSYVKHCEYTLGYDNEGFKLRVPNGSRKITSDDIFDYMLMVRTNNSEISENKETAREEYKNLKFSESIKFRGLNDYEDFRLQVLSRRRTISRREFIKRTAGSENRLFSNGETALKYFEEKIKNDTLYCLDEPENSLSPKMQMEFVKIIEEATRYCGCQFIIATHSPFLLALNGARIFDLDSCPTEIKDWWTLENPKIYFDFFDKHRNLFLEDCDDIV